MDGDSGGLTRLKEICNALCNAENQPHQWHGAPAELWEHILDAIATPCGERAEWAIYDKPPDVITYSCTDHLGLLVTDDTITIDALKEGGDIECAFLELFALR